jgi:hypothetical protein
LGGLPYVFRKIAGSQKRIYSLELDRARQPSHGGVQPAQSSKPLQLRKSNDQPERKQNSFNSPAAKDIEEICSEVRLTIQSWQTQSVLDNGQRAVESMNPTMLKSTQQRNVKMAEVIAEAIRSNKKPVVIVGYTHLYGTLGLLEIFKQAGYEIVEYKK